MGNRCRYRGRTRQPRCGPGRLGDRAVHDALFVPGGHRQAHDRSREFDRISHIFFRTIRPTMRRYVECDSPCMAERSQAGGDALLNLGGHGFDIAWFVTGEKPEVISAVLSQPPHPGEVEDYTLATLRTPSGILFHNEVGYKMSTGPANRTDGEKRLQESRFCCAGCNCLRLIVMSRSRARRRQDGYPSAVREALEAYGRGDPPPIPASECAHAVRLIFDSCRAAGLC